MGPPLGARGARYRGPAEQGRPLPVQQLVAEQWDGAHPLVVAAWRRCWPGHGRVGWLLAVCPRGGAPGGACESTCMHGHAGRGGQAERGGGSVSGYERRREVCWARGEGGCF